MNTHKMIIWLGHNNISVNDVLNNYDDNMCIILTVYTLGGISLGKI